jgi:hypothetical protein
VRPEARVGVVGWLFFSRPPRKKDVVLFADDGVRGELVADFKGEERGVEEVLVGVMAAVLVNFVDDDILKGEGDLPLTALVGVTLGPPCGLTLPANGEEETAPGRPIPFLSFRSPSEVVGRLRLSDFVGDASSDVSTMTDLGLYFGKADAATVWLRVVGRNEDERTCPVTACGGSAASTSVADSSDDMDCLGRKDVLLVARVIVLNGSGVGVLFPPETLRSPSPVALEFVAARLNVLERRLLSRPFFVVLSTSFASLLITSANALPTEDRFKDCRIDVRGLLSGLCF